MVRKLLFCFAIAWLCRASDYQIIGYLFPQDSVIDPRTITVEKMTRINYAFANLRNGQVVEGFAHDAENFAILNKLKSQNQNLKILISVGGWTWSGAFSDASLTQASRKVFVDSAVSFVEKYNLDGVDIDWEYPGQIGDGNLFRPDDKQNYTALLTDLRKALDEAGKRLHKHFYTSVATGANQDFLDHTELGKVAKQVDTVNLMSYDYYEPSDDKIAGHHAPLFTNPADPKQVSADASVALYRAAGVPAKKIVLGVPFYGHAWISAGLYQAGIGAQPPSDLTGLERHFDAVSQVPYFYDPARKLFVSADDPQSLALKCAYVKKHHLGGVMFWDYTSDSTGRLLNALYTALR